MKLTINICFLIMVFFASSGCTKKSDRDHVTEYHAYGKTWKYQVIGHTVKKKQLFTGHGIIGDVDHSWSESFLITPEGKKISFTTTIRILQKNGNYQSYDKMGQFRYSFVNALNYDDRLFIRILDKIGNLTDCPIYSANHVMEKALLEHPDRSPLAYVFGELNPENNIFYVDEFVASYDETERRGFMRLHNGLDDRFLFDHRVKFCTENQKPIEAGGS